MRRHPVPSESLSHSGVLNGYLMPLIAVIVFAFFVVVAVINTFTSSKEYVADLMQQDIKKLTEIFKRVDADCGIMSFDYVKNPINFLNVGTFAGSGVGPMHLIHADKWSGPYLKENLTTQSKEYVLRRTKKGLFITPDDGVKLPSGKFIGSDIILDENTDISAMLQPDGALNYKGKLLAAPLELSDKKGLLQEAAIKQFM